MNIGMNVKASTRPYDREKSKYADDTQVCGSCLPADVDDLSARLTVFTYTVASWMQSNRLQLNPDKTASSSTTQIPIVR